MSLPLKAAEAEGTQHLPDFDDVLDVLGLVWPCGDDQNPVEEVDRKPVGTLHFRAPDSCHATIGRHNNQGSKFVFEGTIQEREAFDIEHVNFVNEEYLSVIIRRMS